MRLDHLLSKEHSPTIGWCRECVIVTKRVTHTAHGWNIRQVNLSARLCEYVGCFGGLLESVGEWLGLRKECILLGPGRPAGRTWCVVDWILDPLSQDMLLVGVGSTVR